MWERGCGPGGRRRCGCGGGRPEGFLAPCLLLLLHEAPVHGYELMERMERLGLWEGTPDPGAVYRHLRRLEEEGLVTSDWATGGPGPARRLYRLTPGGEGRLHELAQAVERTKAALDTFLALYARAFPAGRSC